MALRIFLSAGLLCVLGEISSVFAQEKEILVRPGTPVRVLAPSIFNKVQVGSMQALRSDTLTIMIEDELSPGALKGRLMPNIIPLSAINRIEVSQGQVAPGRVSVRA